MPKSDLTYRTNTDEADTKTNDTSDVIENITQKVKSAPREEGQDVRDYIQKQGTHTGLIGAVVGTIMAAASFVSELAGTIVRNLLWSQQMQDAIANRLNRESPRKTSTVVDKEKTSKEETKIEKETPQVNIKNLMKQYDINGRKFGDSGMVFSDRSLENLDIGYLSDDTIKDNYIRPKIRQSSVTIVLIGKDTGGRWWIDWEIYYSMLKTYGNERNGVLGILLPNKEHNIPKRISENLDYCEIIPMPQSKLELEQAIERAYSKRFTMPDLSSPLRKRNS